MIGNARRQMMTKEELKVEAKKLGYIVVKKPYYQCSCYCSYPNINHEHKNGKWKCVDNYECIQPLEEIKLPGLPFPRVIKKTKCVKVR